MTAAERLKKVEAALAELNIRMSGVGGGVGGNHNFLSATHPDTDPDSPVRGDIVVGIAGPEWQRYAIGAAGRFLRSDGNDPSWQALQAGDLPAHAAEHEIGGGDLVDHDVLTNFVVNEHIDHTVVSISGGTGLAGGGTIAANRTISLSHLGLEALADPNADRLVFWDDSAGALKWLAPDDTTIEVNLTTLQVKAGGIGSTHIGTSFGVEATNLHNFISTAFTNRTYANVDRDSARDDATLFDALINAGGTGGLTATNVPYAGDSNEKTLVPGPAAYDGYIILHNTTRGNSRRVVNIDRTNNFITTVNSVDDWADNDVLEAESQTCVAGVIRFMDFDISGQVPATCVAVALEIAAYGDGEEIFYVQPYEAYGAGKIQQVYSGSTGGRIYKTFILKVNSQKICIAWMASGANAFSVYIRCIGYWENADT